MSKHLYLLRHAKSSWDDTHQKDFDRPLNDRGKKAAPLMGRVIKDRELDIDRIICSPSKRTRETLELLQKEANLKASTDFVDGIYEASVGELRKIVRSQKDKHDAVLLIGHNPGMESLLADLTGEYERFPTACLASIALNISEWRDLDPDCGKMEWILRPRSL